MLEMIEEPNRTACKNILADNLELFQAVQGGAHNHHTWPEAKRVRKITI